MPLEPSGGVKYSEEYLDLMLQWGTIADIPDLVRAVTHLKLLVDERDHDIARLQEEVEELRYERR